MNLFKTMGFKAAVVSTLMLVVFFNRLVRRHLFHCDRPDRRRPDRRAN